MTKRGLLPNTPHKQGQTRIGKRTLKFSCAAKGEQAGLTRRRLRHEAVLGVASPSCSSCGFSSFAEHGTGPTCHLGHLHGTETITGHASPSAGQHKATKHHTSSTNSSSPVGSCGRDFGLCYNECILLVRRNLYRDVAIPTGTPLCDRARIPLG